MGKKLFIGGLSWTTNDESLRNSFEPFGPIEDARVILDRETGRSRGFGFVTYINDDSAGKAISSLDGTELDGRNIRVNEAVDRPDRSSSGMNRRY